MPKDVLITPLSSKIEFKDNGSNIDGLIQLDASDNLSITSPNGSLNLGNSSGNVFIGNGTNVTDIVFEQNGSIRALTAKTLTLGQNDSSVDFASRTTAFKGGTAEIKLRTLDDGTLSFEGSAGQLFSITDSLSGTIFSVNDISGIPSIEVLDDGTVKLAEYGGSVQIRAAINIRTASYTLSGSDYGKIIEMNVASANNLTIPLNSSVAMPIGASIDIVQYGVGQTTIVPASGVTIRSKEGALKITGQYSGVTLYKRGTDEWVAMGDLSS